jgi:membrane protein YqaA with SNARE-associated domain
MKMDSKTLVALVVLIGTFVLLGIYAWRGQTPDAVMVAVVGPLAGGAAGYFFGRVNGATEANLLAILQDRRAGVTTIPVQVTAQKAGG